MNSVACIGNGFVGGSLTTVLGEKGFDVFVFDKAGKAVTGAKVQIRLDGKNSHESVVWEKPFESVTDLVDKCERFVSNFSNIYFVCVPTPMFEDGQCDTSIVESVLSDLAKMSGNRIAVVKSTVPPGSTEAWNEKYKLTGLRVIFCPEFLTEANALDDMRNQNRIVLGGPRPFINKVKQLFAEAFPKVPIIKTSSTTAEMVKYFTNIQLAARVVLSCEFAQICEALDSSGFDIDYDKVQEYAVYDKRLGDSHMSMPEVRGARGHCFPKDLAAIVHLSQELKIIPSLMQAIQDKNLSIVAPENRDWEKMNDRAVTKREK